MPSPILAYFVQCSMLIFIFCHLQKNGRKNVEPNQQKLLCSLSCRVAVRHVKVKPGCAVLTMLKRLDKIRFRGPRTRDDFPDLAESPPASDNECSDDMQLKTRTTLRDTEDLLRDPVSILYCISCFLLIIHEFMSFPLFSFFLFSRSSCFCLIYWILIWS